MWHVYILRSTDHPRELYTGSTSDLNSRLKVHNAGGSKHTNKFRPWKIIWSASFETKEKAELFERYLKTPSGKAFRNKRLI